MRRRFEAAALSTIAAALACLPAGAQQSGVNPDLSAIAEFIACPGNAENCAYEDADGELNFQELEIALQGYLNPYVRGDVFVGFHGDHVEVEEAYASFLRGLGPFQARLGQRRLSWGTVNPLHPHAYSWIFAPLVEERLFGEEGLNQISASLDVSFPAGDRGEITLAGSLLRGDLASEGHVHGGEGEEEHEVGGTICVGPGCDDGICQPGDTDCALVFYEPAAHAEADASPEMAYQLRASWFDEFRPAHSIVVGVNALQGTIDPALDRAVTWLGGDFKYRWRPDKYRSLNVIGSYVRNRIDLEGEVATGSVCVGPDCAAGVCPEGGVCREFETTEHVKGEAITTSGWYLIADWQFAERWNAGLKYDRSEGLESKDAWTRQEAFLNFRIMEESTLFRLLARREDRDELEEPRWSAALQMVFSLGPHRPHSF